MVLCHRVIQAGSQGQWVGRCRIGWRWGRARRAGMLTRWRRRVAPRALRWRVPARVAAARSRLCAMAAQIAHAELAPKRPEGMWARGPSMRSAKVVSMMAWRRWVISADREQPVGGLVGVFDAAHDQAGGDCPGAGFGDGVGGLGDLGIRDPGPGIGSRTAPGY